MSGNRQMKLLGSVGLLLGFVPTCPNGGGAAR